MSDAEHAYQWKRRDSILYRAELSTLYHRKRGRFLALLDKWGKLFTLLFGSAAFVQLLTVDKHPLLALPFAILAFANLIFDFAECARKHGELACDFKMLEATIEASGERDFTEDSLNAWSARIREIESGGWPTYTLLLRMCQNEIARAKGKSADITHIPWWRSKLANFIRFSNYEVKTARP
jgi:hypothetical protein